MKKMHIIALVLGVLALGALLVAFVRPQSPFSSDSKLQVVTSFYPLYFFAQEIGGDYASVENITPAGAEPHEYEPTPKDTIRISNADLVVLQGAHFEAWGENIEQNIDTSKTTIVLAADSLATQTLEEGEQHEEESGEHEEHGGLDPHTWLSPALATLMVDRIADGFVKADRSHEKEYRANADALKAKLSTLDTSYRTSLAGCTDTHIVTSHAAFGYLASAYGLTQVPISGLSPDQEPSVQELAAITSFAKEHNVKFIFFESLVSPKLAETIANEIGAETLVLNPLEGLSTMDILSGKNYFTVMEENLVNLRKALSCT